jgi:hypothetical protein
VFDSLLKENTAGIQQITFVPDRAALQFALEQQKATGGAKPTAAPAPQAKPTAPTVKPK